MNKFLQPKNLPILMLASGAAGMGLQWLTYAAAVDGKGLLIPHHPVEIALWLLSIGALALVVSVAVTMGGVGDYAANFPPSPLGAFGNFVMAGAIGATVLYYPCAMGGTIAAAWWWLGLAAAAALIWIGCRRLQGKAPCFVLHLLVCAFLGAHILTHYQLWSGTPQLQDYVFHLLGAMVLLFFGYYQTAFDVDLGMRRMQLTMGMMAIFLCTVALTDTAYPLLYMGGIVWTWTNLCKFQVPREKEEA